MPYRSMIRCPVRASNARWVSARRRRASGNKDPHVADQFPVEARVAEKARIEGRHTHHRRCPGELGNDLIKVEPGQEDHGAGGAENDVGRHEQPVSVVDGQDVQQYIPRGEMPGLDQGIGIGTQVAVRQHRSLGPPGRAGGVEDYREITFGAGNSVELGIRGTEPLRKGTATTCIQSQDFPTAGFCDRPYRCFRDGIGYHHAWSGIADEEFHLHCRVCGVQRQEHPRPSAGRQDTGRAPSATCLPASRRGHPVEHPASPERWPPGRRENTCSSHSPRIRLQETGAASAVRRAGRQALLPGDSCGVSFSSKVDHARGDVHHRDPARAGESMRAARSCDQTRGRRSCGDPCRHRRERIPSSGATTGRRRRSL